MRKLAHRLLLAALLDLLAGLLVRSLTVAADTGVPEAPELSRSVLNRKESRHFRKWKLLRPMTFSLDLPDRANQFG
jgi:hypothetical protein